MLDDYEAEARTRSIELEALGKLLGPRGISSGKPLERHAAKDISKIRFGPWDNGPWPLDEATPLTPEQIAGFATARVRYQQPPAAPEHDPIPPTPTYTDLHYPLTGSEQQEMRRLRVALELADYADTFVALVKRQKIPAAPEWFRQRLAAIQRRR